MAEPEKISMWRETFRGLDRMVEAIVNIFVTPWRFSRRLCLAGVVVLALVGGNFLFPWLFPQGLDAAGLIKHSEVVRNYGLLVTGIVAVCFGIWRSIIAHRQTEIARQQANLTEQGQITDRYTEAVKMLSEDKTRTRVGAVYALARIAQDSVERDHIPVMEVLTEFIRNPPYNKEAVERAEARNRSDYPPMAIRCRDIHAALNVIWDRNDVQKTRERAGGFTPNFHGAALQELDLSLSNFTGGNLYAANLTGAKLQGAYLRRAYFSAANLYGADLDRADLYRADLSKANLGDVKNLTQCQLDYALPTEPPQSLPRGLVWRFVETDGKWVKEG